MKKIDLLSWAIIFSILGSTLIINYRLNTINTSIENASIPKLAILDKKQFSSLCGNLAKQWDVKDYAFYILQPNSSVKTHKELALSSLDTQLPFRLPVHSYNDLTENPDYYTGENFSKFVKTEVNENRNFVLIPIYKHNIIVGEFILFYDNVEQAEKLDIKAMESQTISMLLM